MEAGLLDPAPIWTDIKTFPCEAFRDRVDILVAGYPCQPFSAAGKRLGTEDPRHLWPYIARSIGIIRPRMCFFENVEGHISLGLREVIGELESIGYTAAWGIFSASEVGAPHQRKRVFILAHRSDSGLQRREWFRQTRAQGESSGHASECGSTMADSFSQRLERQSGDRKNDTQGREEQSRSIGSQSICGTNLADSLREREPCRNSGRKNAMDADSSGNLKLRDERSVWQKVVWAAERECSCGEHGCAGECGCPLVCARCGGEYSERGCYGPTQDGIEYEWRDGVLYGRPEQAWPSRPGEQQHWWEPPRVMGNAVRIHEHKSCGGGSQQHESWDASEAMGNAKQFLLPATREHGAMDEASGIPTDREGCESAQADPEPSAARKREGNWADASERGQAQPPLGRDADGPAGGLGYAELCISCDNRNDELRLLGNGVVPATAERAFRTLWEELLK
jgi:hypothetical protein